MKIFKQEEMNKWGINEWIFWGSAYFSQQILNILPSLQPSQFLHNPVPNQVQIYIYYSTQITRINKS